MDSDKYTWKYLDISTERYEDLDRKKDNWFGRGN